MKGRGAFPMLRLKRLSKEIKPSNGHRGFTKKMPDFYNARARPLGRAGPEVEFP